MTTPRKFTPKQIKAIRERLELTQARAAEKVGVSRSHWAAMETGQQHFSKSVAILIDMLDRGVF